MKHQHHTPVLLNEVIEALNPSSGKTYIDTTFGAGGYSKAILDKASCNVIGIDCDQITINYADKLKNTYQDKFTFINDNFINIDSVLNNLNISKIDGIVFDLGVSSMQLDNKDRGFSFNGDATLDMRMDNKISLTAKKLVNTLYQEELANLIYNFGGEKKSRLIAKNIINYRQKQKIESTSQLVQAIGLTKYNDKIHFATRTFQALRISVNNELENLKNTLKKLPNFLKNGGIISVVTFHSLEDKIVKDFFKTMGLQSNFERINKKVIIPKYAEIRSNPRARSAKLRSLRKIHEI